MRALLLALPLLAAACGQQGVTSADNELAAPGTASADGNITATEPSAPEASAPADAPTAETLEPAPDLGLAEGYYVLAGGNCRAPSNAEFRVWDGKGLSGSATTNCSLTPVAQKPNGVQVEQTCTDTYTGKRSMTDFIIAVSGRERFSVIGEGGDGSYRLCPIDQVPAWLKDAKPLSRQ